MPKKKKNHLPKLGKIELTAEQQAIIQSEADSALLKVITEVIIPQRVVQIALTLLQTGTDTDDLRYFQGMKRNTEWFLKFILGAAEPDHEISDTEVGYNNDDDRPEATDDLPS